MDHLSRATALKTAAVLSFLLGIYNLFRMFPFLTRGAVDVNQAVDAPPYFIVLLALGLAIVMMVAAFSVWQNQRWGVVITLLASAVTLITAVPGILAGPTLASQLSTMLVTIVSLVLIVFCLWRDRRSTRA